MIRAVFPCVLLVILTAFPAAQAVVDGEVDMTFPSISHMRTVTESTWKDEAAELVRSESDANSDGMVSATEAATAAQQIRSSVAGEVKPEDFTMDGEDAVDADLSAFDVRDLQGMVDSTVPVRMDWTVEYRFDVGSGKTHRLAEGESDDDDEESPFETGVVKFMMRAPDGYRIKEYPNFPYLEVSSDKKTLTAETQGDEGEDDEMYLVFEKVSSGGDSQAPGMVLAILAAGLVLAAARRRGA